MGTLFLLVSSESIKGHILNVLCGCNGRNCRDQVYYFLCHCKIRLQTGYFQQISYGRHLRLISHRLEKGPWGLWGRGEGTLSLNIGCAPSYSPLSNQPFCYFVIFMIHLQNDTDHSCSKLFHTLVFSV